MKKPKLWLFDWDGTLYDSVSVMYKGVCNVFNLHGVPTPTFSEFCRTFRAPYAGYYASRGILSSPEKIREQYFEAVNLEKPTVFPDVHVVLQALAERNEPMIVISAHLEHEVVQRCEEAGLHTFFLQIIGNAHHKVETIRSVCEKQGIDLQDTWYIGDIISDMEHAREAGVVPIGITRGNDTKDVLIEAGARLCVEGLHELLHFSA